MEIPSLPEANTVLVFGPVASGKSFLLQQWLSGLERTLTIDTTAECMDDSFSHIWGSPKELLTKLKENPFYYRIAYHPSSRNFENDFKWCVEGIWLSGKEENGKLIPMSRWLFVDEVHEVCSNHSVLESMDLTIRYARHNLLGFVGATHKFSDVNKLMTGNARMIVLFHTMEPVDLDAIRKRLGEHVEKQVKELRPLIYDDTTKVVEQEPECLVWVRGRGEPVIYSLGDKIKGEICQETSKEVQLMPEVPSLERNSGKPEPKSQELLPETGIPQ